MFRICVTGRSVRLVRAFFWWREKDVADAGRLRQLKLPHSTARRRVVRALSATLLQVPNLYFEAKRWSRVLVCVCGGSPLFHFFHIWAKDVPLAPEWGIRQSRLPLRSDQCGSCSDGPPRRLSMMGYIMGCTCFKGIKFCVVPFLSCTCFEGMSYRLAFITFCCFWLLFFWVASTY